MRAEDIVPAIDDIRNGVLLQASFYRLLRRTLAFMPLPNFTMDATDVHLLPGADADRDRDPSSSSSSSQYQQICIVHLFEPLRSFPIANTALRHPPSSSSPSLSLSLSLSSPSHTTDSEHWPPPALFDAIYSAAVLHTFGTAQLHTRALHLWTCSTTPRAGAPMPPPLQRACASDGGACGAPSRRIAWRASATGEGGGPELLDVAMLGPYLGMGRGELMACLMDREEEDWAMEEEQKQMRESVRRWREGVAKAWASSSASP